MLRQWKKGGLETFISYILIYFHILSEISMIQSIRIPKIFVAVRLAELFQIWPTPQLGTLWSLKSYFFIFCLTLKEKKLCFPTVWDDFNEAIQGRKIFVREDREFGALVSHPLFYISYLFLFFIHFAFGKKVDESLSKDWKPKQFPRLRT